MCVEINEKPFYHEKDETNKFYTQAVTAVPSAFQHQYLSLWILYVKHHFFKFHRKAKTINLLKEVAGSVKNWGKYAKSAELFTGDRNRIEKTFRLEIAPLLFRP